MELKLKEEVERNTNIEQYTKRENLRFNKIPESEDENCKAIIYDVISSLGVNESNKSDKSIKSNKVVFYMLISFVSVLFSFSPQFVNSKPAISIYKLCLWIPHGLLCFRLPSWFCLIMTDFKVCSLNVRGLGEQLKRR